MAAGPQEQKLREYLTPARRWQVWMARDQVGRPVRRHSETSPTGSPEARPLARENLGNHTADAADLAFIAMQDKVTERRKQMQTGAKALQSAIEAMSRAESVRNGFDADGPINEPTSPDYSGDEVEQIQQMKIHNARMNSYHSQVSAREEAARAAITDLDETNQSSTETMRSIQGEAPTGGSGGGGGAGGGGRGGGGGTGGGAGWRGRPDPVAAVVTRDPPPTTRRRSILRPTTGGTQDPPTIDEPPTGDLPTGDPTGPIPEETGTPLGPTGQAPGRQLRRPGPLVQPWRRDVDLGQHRRARRRGRGRSRRRRRRDGWRGAWRHAGDGARVRAGRAIGSWSRAAGLGALGRGTGGAAGAGRGSRPGRTQRRSRARSPAAGGGAAGRGRYGWPGRGRCPWCRWCRWPGRAQAVRTRSPRRSTT